MKDTCPEFPDRGCVRPEQPLLDLQPRPCVWAIPVGCLTYDDQVVHHQLPEIGPHALGVLALHLQADLLQDLARHGVDFCWLQAGAERVEILSAALPRSASAIWLRALLCVHRNNTLRSRCIVRAPYTYSKPRGRDSMTCHVPHDSGMAIRARRMHAHSDERKT